VLAVDTNVLVYAHRRDSPFHDAAAGLVRRLAEGAATWAIPWPCLHEFYSVVTHPRIYAPPSTPEQATAQVTGWLGAPSVVLIGESEGYWDTIEPLLLGGRVSGPLVHDARVAAICAQHGVRELFSQDRDFSRFPQVRVRRLLA
jgi:toxin-antitoxin system PIN domain toxin